MCFLRESCETLFLYRHAGEGDIHHGYYVPPGGRTERGERGIDCIMREFLEETGLRLLDPQLKTISTFYNQGRILGGNKDPDDWCVETYLAHRHTGELRAEHARAHLVWIPDTKIETIRMHEGDRKILNLLEQEGVYETIAQYSGETLIRFDSRRVS